eukprot:INCI13080.3.p1 GENE.INCI13080.3~~INCI13080.3.p1  ORF type:complete len:1652 (-),score=267.90 INCI13080.3:98-5053(-)
MMQRTVRTRGGIDGFFVDAVGRTNKSSSVVSRTGSSGVGAGAGGDRKIQLRIVASNPLGTFNAGESLVVLCEVYHNDKLFCRFQRLSSQWYACKKCLHELPKSARLRLTFLRPVNLAQVATELAFANCGTVELPLHIDPEPRSKGWTVGYHLVALTKDYEDVAASGWVDVCCKATQNRWVRAYIVVKGTVLKWQATESGGDTLGVAQWQFLYLDQNLLFSFPSQRADARNYAASGFAALDIFQAPTPSNDVDDVKQPVLSIAPILDSSRDAQQIMHDSRVIVQSLLENAHVYPAGMLQKTFPAILQRDPADPSRVISGGTNTHCGKALDGVTRSIVVQLKNVSAAEIHDLSGAVRTPHGRPAILEGSVNVLHFVRGNRRHRSQWPSADSSRLVQAMLVLYPDRLVWYREREKLTVLGELRLRDYSVRRATTTEESPPVVASQGNIRRETFGRGCFTLVEDAAVAAERFEGSGGRHFQQQRWVFDVAPSVFPAVLHNDDQSSSAAVSATTDAPDGGEIRSGRNGSRSMAPPSYKLANNSFLVTTSSLDNVRVHWIDAISACMEALRGSPSDSSSKEAYEQQSSSGRSDLPARQIPMIKTDPLLTLTRAEKRVVWVHRERVPKSPRHLRRFFQATNWQDTTQLVTAKRILQSLQQEKHAGEAPEQVLRNVIQCLDATVADSVPCRFIVEYVAQNGFRKRSTLLFLAQLVQGLKLCWHVDGPEVPEPVAVDSEFGKHVGDDRISTVLENFLYRCAFSDPLAFGVYLFWLLQVETFGVFHPEPAFMALQQRLLRCKEPWLGARKLSVVRTGVARKSGSAAKRRATAGSTPFGIESCSTVGNLIRGQVDLWGGNGLIAQIVRTIHRAQHKRADPYELIFDSEKRRIGGFLKLNIIVRDQQLVTGWTRRWTVLFDRGIQYFQNDSDQAAKGYIPLTASSQVKECTSFDGRLVKNCFVVFVSPDGFKATDRSAKERHQYVLYGQCENHQQYLMWVSQLSHAIVDLKNSARDDAENISNFNTETRRKFRCVFNEGVYFHSSPVGVVIVDMKLEMGDTVYGAVSSEHPHWIEVAHNLWLPIVYEPQMEFASSKAKQQYLAQREKANFPRQVMLEDITHTLDTSSVALLFKIGDDLRQDMLVLRLFELFDGFWRRHGLDLPLPRNRIISTWRDGGVVEIVPDSATLAEIQTTFGGGVFGSFAKNPITQYLQSHNESPEAFAESLDLFTRSVAASCVSSCVLGFGDRHNDNIMVTKSGQLFHIDFGHFLGHTMLAPTGQRRERTRFVLTQAMVHTVRQQGEHGMPRLVEMCVKAYLILRSKAHFILQYLNMMIPAQLPEMQSAASVEYVREMLHPEMDEEAAATWFINTIDSCFRDGVEFAKSFDDSMHILGQSSRKSVTRRLTAILQSSLMKKLPRVPVIAPYGKVLGPIVYERCVVSGSNARPVILTFETLGSEKSETRSGAGAHHSSLEDGFAYERRQSLLQRPPSLSSAVLSHDQKHAAGKSREGVTKDTPLPSYSPASSGPNSPSISATKFEITKMDLDAFCHQLELPKAADPMSDFSNSSQVKAQSHSLRDNVLPKSIDTSRSMNVPRRRSPTHETQHLHLQHDLHSERGEAKQPHPQPRAHQRQKKASQTSSNCFIDDSRKCERVHGRKASSPHT